MCRWCYVRVLVAYGLLTLCACSRQKTTDRPVVDADGRVEPASVSKAASPAGGQAEPITQPGRPSGPTVPRTESGRASPVVMSGWSLEKPTVALHDGAYPDKSVSAGDFDRKPFRIQPKPEHRLIVFECRISAIDADATAIDALSSKRKEAFGTVPDGALKFLRGDGDLGLKTRERLRGKYRLFDMERVALTDPTTKKYLPIWCLSPQGGLTVVFTPSRSADHCKAWQYRDGADVPFLGTLAVRTNANRGLKTAGRFLRLMEVGEAETVSLLFELPAAARPEALKVTIEGATPVAVTVKK